MKYKVGQRVWWKSGKYLYIGSIVSDAVYICSADNVAVYDVMSHKNIKPIITVKAQLGNAD